MKLDELREKTKRWRWLDPGAMRFTLGVAELQELMAEVNRELDDVRTAGYLQGVHEAGERRRIRELEASGRAVAEMRAFVPAASPLGVELSQVRDRLNALELERSEMWSRLNALERVQAQDCAAVPLDLATVNARIGDVESAIRHGVASDKDQDARLTVLELWTVNARIGDMESAIRHGVASDKDQDARLAVLELWKGDIAELCRLANDRAAKQG